MGSRRICNLRLYVLSGLTVMVFITIMNFTGIEQFHLAQKAWEKEKLNGQQAFVPPESTEAIFKEGEVGNYEPIPEERRRGPGEYGRGAKPANNQTAYNLYGCDMTVSDNISLDRTLYDSRDKECRFWHYPRHLPTASVIVIFYNEGNSTLLRTVHSVINRSPPQLLREVVLVDDASTMDHLKEPLEKYIQRFNGKVKIYRNRERLGLIGARMRGAKEAVGDVIVVLDSHCECNVNWLPPLLQRIALNRTTLAQPTVDMITHDSFKLVRLHKRNHLAMGVFDWGLLYKEIRLPKRIKNDRKHPTEPYGTATHAGGLFAIDRKYFFEIGGYDANLFVWGAENFQLSFKLWMCGGRLEWVPCSRVGHVYHKFIPYSLEVKNVQTKGVDLIKQNFQRVAEGWMDDYKKYFYIREPSLRSHTVNVTEELLLRKKLKCKNFDWYMQNVANGMLDYYPLPVPNKSWGKIQQRHRQKCLWSDGRAGPCTQEIYRYNEAGQISAGEYCMVLTKDKLGVRFRNCPDPRADVWEWKEITGLIRHPSVNLCIQSSADDQDSRVTLETCDPENEDQMWEMKKIQL